MPKRGQNEGSVVERGDGRARPFEARITLTDGKRRLLGYYRTKTDARDAIKKALGDMDRGVLAMGPDMTVAEYLDYWLREVATPRLKPRPLRNYQDIARLHVEPSVGSVKLSKLTPAHLTSLYNELGRKTSPRTGKPLSPKTVKNVHVFLHSALETALKWDWLGRNPADAVTPPRAVHDERTALNAEQRAALLTAAQGDPLEALWMLALTCGLRRGELFGLKWEDLDMAKGTLQVRRSLARIIGQGLVEQEPKTESSRRVVWLTPQAVEVVRRHRAAQAQTRLLAGSEWANRGYVFANCFGKPLDPDNTVHRQYKALLKRAGLESISFHALRHANASWLFDEGADMKDVSEWLGHSRLSTTADIYVHAGTARRASLAQKLGESIAVGG